jgi:hypothetical protein
MKRIVPLVVAFGALAMSCGSDEPGVGVGAQPDAGDSDSLQADAEADQEANAEVPDAAMDAIEEPAPNPELDIKCTPTFTLQLEDTSAKGKLFTDAVPAPEAFVQETGRQVCRILYRKPEEVRDANHLTLIIRDDPDFPGWKSGDVGDITVMISTNHLAAVAAAGGDVAAEIKGILLHEMTHMYQHDDKAPGEGSYPNLGNVIEGVGDFVRIRAGWPPKNAKPSKTGTWDDAGYWKPAFFLLWIDVTFPDFLYRMNLSMKAGDGVSWSPQAIGDITGSSVDGLWQEYKGASCCVGATQSCCK